MAECHSDKQFCRFVELFIAKPNRGATPKTPAVRFLRKKLRKGGNNNITRLVDNIKLHGYVHKSDV